jgi:hypothetical protein
VSRCIATQHAISYEVLVPHPTQYSREVIQSSGNGASSDAATHSGREGIKGGKKRHKQRLQGAMTMTSHDDGNDGEAATPVLGTARPPHAVMNIRRGRPRTTSRGS